MAYEGLKLFVGARPFVAPIDDQVLQPGDLLRWKPQLELHRVNNNPKKVTEVDGPSVL